jgi:hypothetical protein
VVSRQRSGCVLVQGAARVNALHVHSAARCGARPGGDIIDHGIAGFWPGRVSPRRRPCARHPAHTPRRPCRGSPRSRAMPPPLYSLGRQPPAGGMSGVRRTTSTLGHAPGGRLATTAAQRYRLRHPVRLSLMAHGPPRRTGPPPTPRLPRSPQQGSRRPTPHAVPSHPRAREQRRRDSHARTPVGGAWRTSRATSGGPPPACVIKRRAVHLTRTNTAIAPPGTAPHGCRPMRLAPTATHRSPLTQPWERLLALRGGGSGQGLRPVMHTTPWVPTRCVVCVFHGFLPPSPREGLALGHFV